ncbi:MAG TPA: rod-binding protein [Rhizomicrobium sp.]|nr:rod-binding protein [Rhizomicrobium sp.]
MSADAAIMGAMTLAKSAMPTAPHATANAAAAQKAAKQYEGIFVSEFLGSMFEGISTDGPFGGGQGEAMFRSLMLDEYGKQITSRGGFGLSDAITRVLLKHQERAPAQ